MKDALVKILNIQQPEEAWSQATLPVAKGGLGLRPASEVDRDIPGGMRIFLHGKKCVMPL